jgi:hypothetical protein
MSSTREVETHRDQREGGKKTSQVKSKAKNILIMFFDMKGIVHKYFVLTGQTVNSAHYCDVFSVTV